MALGDTKLTLSVATTGSLPAATYSFMTSGYKPPSQPRLIDSDLVSNQNGNFPYVYDDGPGLYTWKPFKIVCDDKWTNILGAGASAQFANLKSLWNRLGSLQLKAPEGIYSVRWSNDMHFEPDFKRFPQAAGDKIEYSVVIQLEEG